MADKTKVIVIRGTLDWAKLTGKARPHTGEKRYDKGPYWSVDVTPNADSLKLVESLGLKEKLREPNSKDKQRVGQGPYLALKVLENKPNSDEKNEPPKIVDLQGKAWDGRLIGNGSVADVKVRVVDYGKSVQKGVYLQAVRVLDLVPYESNDFAPLSEDDEYFAMEEGPNGERLEDSFDSDLDDDVPFNSGS